MAEQKTTVNDVVIARMAKEIGEIKGLLIEAQVHREILLDENRLLRVELNELKTNEIGEGGSDSEPVEEGE